MIVNPPIGKPLNIDIEERSVVRLDNGWIAAFAVFSHQDGDGHSYFDTYHLMREDVRDPPKIFDYAIDEVDHAFDDIFFHRIQDHPFLDVGRVAWGLGKGGYDAAKVAMLSRAHQRELKWMVLGGGLKGAVHWLLVPNLLFYSAKHTAHFLSTFRNANEHHIEYVYLQSNGDGRKYYDNAPWT